MSYKLKSGQNPLKGYKCNWSGRSKSGKSIVKLYAKKNGSAKVISYSTPNASNGKRSIVVIKKTIYKV